MSMSTGFADAIDQVDREAIVAVPAPVAPMLKPAIVNPSEGAQLLYQLQQHTGAGECVVQFVAAHGGEGTSTIVRDVALVAAGLGQRVLLLDLDQGGDRQVAWLREHWRGGPVFRAPEPAFATPDGLVILQAGATGLHVSQLSGAWLPTQAHCAAVFQSLRQAFDLVLVDSLSLDRSADALLVAQYVTTSVLVVAAESTRLKVIEDLRNRITEVGGNIAGVTLNRRRYHIPRWIYNWL